MHCIAAKGVHTNAAPKSDDHPARRPSGRLPSFPGSARGRMPGARCETKELTIALRPGAHNAPLRHTYEFHGEADCLG